MLKQKELVIKGKTIGKGKPLICIPVMKPQKEQIIEEFQKLSALKTDMIEWRVDAFENADDLNAIREVLDALAPIVKDSIFVFTFRSKNQGGLLAYSKEQIEDIHEIAAESHIVDFIDIEFFESSHATREIKKLQKMGTHTISSHHDFEETPSASVIDMLLEQMNTSGTDIVKLAVMPNSPEDVLTLLQETLNFHKKFPNRPLITMSMDALGGISRISGEVFGSCVTFATAGQASAPGQLPAENIDNILSILHNGLSKEV